MFDATGIIRFASGSSDALEMRLTNLNFVGVSKHIGDQFRLSELAFVGAQALPSSVPASPTLATFAYAFHLT